MSDYHTIPEGDDTLSWGLNHPLPAATPSTKLKCALLDALSSPSLGEITYASKPYFTKSDGTSVKSKLCYHRTYSGYELQTILSTIKLQGYQFLPIRVKSRLHRCRNRDSKRYWRVRRFPFSKVLHPQNASHHSRLPRTDLEAYFCKAWREHRRPSIKIRFEWIVSRLALDISDTLDWKVLTAMLRTAVKFSFANVGQTWPHGKKKEFMSADENPQEDLGYLGWAKCMEENRDDWSPFKRMT